MAFALQEIVLLVIVIHTPVIESALCDIPGAGPTLTGSVFEYAPNGTFVLEANFTGEVGVDITLSLNTILDQFFTMSGKTMTVKDNTDITRNDATAGNIIAGGKIVCDIFTPSPPVTKSVIIYIENVNSINTIKFGQDSYTATINETAVIGFKVATVTATDDDVTSIKYSITDQNPPDFFNLQSNSSGNILLAQRLDYEDNKQHTLIISATSLGFDNFGNEYDEVASTSVVIDVIEVIDNFPPQFRPCNALVTDECVTPLYTAMVYEDENQTQYIHPQEINAIDLDSGINSSIIYSFVTGIPEQYHEYFAIDPSTGYMEVIQFINESESFTISVMATEDTGKSSLAYLHISINETFGEEEPCIIKSTLSSEVFYGVIGGLSTLCLIILIILIACLVARSKQAGKPGIYENEPSTAIPMDGIRDSNSEQVYMNPGENNFCICC